MSKTYKPGEPAPVSAQYAIVGPRGGTPPGAPERTGVQGKSLPPTPKPGQRYVVADPTHNGAGKKR